MQELNIPATGTQSLHELQVAMIGKDIKLQPGFFSPDNREDVIGCLKAAGVAVEGPQMGVLVGATERDRALWESQSREPLRPFVEILANACDSQERVDPNTKPHVIMRISQIADGGYQITISDKGTPGQGETYGEGMGVEFFSKWLKEYGTGNENNSSTVGLMGVGAQQSMGLLRNTEDRLIISTQKSGQLLVAMAQQTGDNDILLRHGGLESKKVAKTGTAITFQLSKETVDELQMNTEALIQYLSGKFGGSFDKQIEVIETRSNPDDELPVRERYTTDVTPENSMYRREQLGKGNIKLNWSHEQTTDTDDTATIYLDVLGISYGDPIVIHRKGVPRIIRLNIDQKVTTTTEGRAMFRLTEELINDIQSAILELSYSFRIDPRTRIILMDALAPVIKKLSSPANLPTRLRTDPSLDIGKISTVAYRNVLSGRGNSILTMPPALEDLSPTGNSQIVIIDEMYVPQAFV